MATAKKASTKKTTKKTTVKKTSAKVATPSKKAVVTKVTKSTKALTPFDRIRRLNLTSAVIYVLLAVATITLMMPVTTKMTLSIQTRDEFQGAGTVVLAPASELLKTVQLRYILAGILVIGAIGSLLLATKLRARYEASLKNQTSGFRWTLLGITSGMTLMFVSILTGINDVMTLKIVFGLILITALLGLMSERENKGSKPKWLAFGVAVFAGIIAWLPVAGSLVGTSLFGDQRFGWHVYGVAGVVLLGSILIALSQRAQIRGNKSETVYLSREENYLRIDLLTKIAVVLIVIGALR